MKSPLTALVSGLALTAAAPAVQACATCFGRSDSALAQGMNMGILFLLGVVLAVLAALTGFFVYLGRRAAAVAKAGGPAPSSAPASEPCKT
jgi:hypothetical protein